MAKSTRRRNGNGNGAGPSGRKPRGGFPIVTVIVTVGIAGLLIVLPFMLSGGKKNPETSGTNYAPPPARTYPDIGEWKGLKQGMSESEVRSLLGRPTTESEYAGEKMLEYYENPELAGYFTDAGGSRLRVKIGTDGRVLMYWKPTDAKQIIQEHLEKQQQGG